MPSNVVPQLVWDMDHPVGALVADSVIPSVPLEASIDEALFHGNGCAYAELAQIYGEDAFIDGDGKCLRLTANPVGAQNVTQPGAGKAIILAIPPNANSIFPAYTFDLRVRFGGSTDPTLKYKLEILNAIGPTSHWSLEITTEYVKLTYPTFAGSSTVQTDFETPLVYGTWHAVRLCASNDFIASVRVFVNGVMEILESGGFGVTAPARIYMTHTATAATSGYVDIDRLALVHNLQRGNYTPSGSAATLAFDEYDDPTLVVVPESLQLTVGVFHDWTAEIVGGSGTGIYTVVVYDGELPPGMTLDAYGYFSGTPTGAGTYAVVVKVLDDEGAESYSALTFVVTDPAPGDMVEVDTLSAELKYNYPNDNFHGDVFGLLQAPIAVSDVEIIPLYSYDGTLWRACVLADASPMSGWSAAPGFGVPFGFKWDFRDIVPSDGSTVTVMLTVLARSASIGSNAFPSPTTTYTQIEIGPEQEAPSSVPIDPAITVVEDTELIGYTLFERDSLPVDVIFEYSRDGGMTWSECSEGVGGDGTTGLLASPLGVIHSFAWDTVADNVRGVKLLLRVTPKKSAPGNARLVADFRFGDRIVYAWDFGTGGASAPVPSGDIVLPEPLYGSGLGNRASEYNGTVVAETSRLSLKCDGLGLASIGIPQQGIPGFNGATLGFFMDVNVDLGNTDSVDIDIVSAAGSRVIAKLSLSTAGLSVTVCLGAVSYVLSNASLGCALATVYNFRLSLVPTDDGRAVLVSLLRDGVLVTFDNNNGNANAIVPRAAAIFSDPEVFVRTLFHGAVGATGYVHRLVLIDDDQYVENHVPPTGDDPRTGEWLDGTWWPVSEDENFVGVTALPTDYYTTEGIHGRALAMSGTLEIPNVLSGKRKLLRPGLFKYGFGIEFNAKLSADGGDFRVSVVGPGGVDLEITFGPVSGMVNVAVVDSLAATLNLEYPYAGASWLPDSASWHHFRVSVRRAPDWTVAISVDGSKPTTSVMPAIPNMFVTGTGYRMLFELPGFVGPDPAMIDDVKVWDGYHMNPHPNPSPEEPQTSYWKP